MAHLRNKDDARQTILLYYYYTRQSIATELDIVMGICQILSVKTQKEFKVDIDSDYGLSRLLNRAAKFCNLQR